MLSAHMKHLGLVILVVLGALAASAAVALAHSTPFAWTASKARVVLQEEATIVLPDAERVALDAELEALLDKLRLLELTAGSAPEDRPVLATYTNYIKRFRKAQNTVNAGLSIDTVKCAGQGKALTGKRYKHFRCPTSSYVLEIRTSSSSPVRTPICPRWSSCPRAGSAPAPLSSPST